MFRSSSRLLLLSLLARHSAALAPSSRHVGPFSSSTLSNLRTTATISSSSIATRLFATTSDEPRQFIKNNHDDEEQEMSVELSELQAAYQAHQKNAPKLSHAQEVKSLVAYNHGFAVLSTFSKHHPDFPAGGVVAFAPDEQGRPIMVLSNLSTHKQDLKLNPKCSLTVASKEFKGLSDGRVNLMGTCEFVSDPEEQASAKQIFLAKHPNAFWVDFGDFDVIRMNVEHVRFVGGFARVGNMNAQDYAAARPDPIAAFGGHIAKHMNEDHMDATIAIVQSNIPGMNNPQNKITSAVITSVDSLGMYIKVATESPGDFMPQEFKTRLPFPRQAKDRADVKTLIVELTQATATAASS
jgi:putative heme iron utilization protein